MSNVPPPSYTSLFGNDSGSNSNNQQRSQQNGQQNGYPYVGSAQRPPAFNPVYPGAPPASNLHASTLTDHANSQFNGYSSFPPPAPSSLPQAAHSSLPYPTSPSAAFPTAANLNNYTAYSAAPNEESASRKSSGGGNWWPFGGGGSKSNSKQASPNHNNSLPYPQGSGSHHQYQAFPAASSTSTQQHAPTASRRDPFATVHYSSEEENELRGLFAAVDEDGDGHITIPELQCALLNDNWTPFKSATVQMLLRMFDHRDVNQTIEFEEFRDMKSYVEQFQSIFNTYDADRSGTIDAREVSQALIGLGFNVSAQLCQFLCAHFNNTNNNSRHRPQADAAVNLDSFIQICAAFKQLTAEYESKHGSMASHAHNRQQLEAYENFLRTQLQRMR